MASFVFFYFAVVIVLTSVLVIAFKNPIQSVLSLLLMFLHVAGLYVTLHAEFLFAVQLMVYAGAILVLYLFVVMLINVRVEQSFHSQLPVGLVFVIALLTEIVLVILQRTSTGEADGLPTPSLTPNTIGNTEAIGEVLYTTYLFPFEVASLILLVAMVGSVILAKRTMEEDKT